MVWKAIVEIFKQMNKVSEVIPFFHGLRRREKEERPGTAHRGKPQPGFPLGSGSISPSCQILEVRAAKWPQLPAELPGKGLLGGRGQLLTTLGAWLPHPAHNGRFQVTGPSLQVPGSPACQHHHAATPQNACLPPPQATLLLCSNSKAVSLGGGRGQS